MSRSEIEREVAEALSAAVPGVKAAELDRARLLRDQIEIDSMDILSFVLALEARLSIEVPPASYPLFASLDHAVACVAELLGTRGPPR